MAFPGRTFGIIGVHGMSQGLPGKAGAVVCDCEKQMSRGIVKFHPDCGEGEPYCISKEILKYLAAQLRVQSEKHFQIRAEGFHLFPNERFFQIWIFHGSALTVCLSQAQGSEEKTRILCPCWHKSLADSSSRWRRFMLSAYCSSLRI